MRIISGYLKGKKINLPKDKKTRPLKDMVKESIFNILVHSNKIKFQIKNSEILDLFSGSGSFGLECVSRGAKRVYFNESYKEAIEILKKNIKILNCEDKSTLIEIDSFKIENILKKLNKKFDLIFIDPPFKEKKINVILKILLNLKILKTNGVIIIHRNKKINEVITDKLNIIETRDYGISKIILGN
jgi:16S rRNA (guanine966-N2)-methyltransferase